MENIKKIDNLKIKNGFDYKCLLCKKTISKIKTLVMCEECLKLCLTNITTEQDEKKAKKIYEELDIMKNRSEKLAIKLNEYNITLKASYICDDYIDYINNGNGDVDEICENINTIRFLSEKTNYDVILKKLVGNKKESIYIAVEDFVKKNGEKSIMELPNKLLEIYYKFNI